MLREDRARAVCGLEVRLEEVKRLVRAGAMKASGRLGEVRDGAHADAAVHCDGGVDEALGEVVDAAEFGLAVSRGLANAEAPCERWLDVLVVDGEERRHTPELDVLPRLLEDLPGVREVARRGRLLASEVVGDVRGPRSKFVGRELW